jgi:hypothetical protein
VIKLASITPEVCVYADVVMSDILIKPTTAPDGEALIRTGKTVVKKKVLELCATPVGPFPKV